MTRNFQGLKKKESPSEIQTTIFFRHPLLYILITTISLKIDFTWINDVPEHILDILTNRLSFFYKQPVYKQLTLRWQIA